MTSKTDNTLLSKMDIGKGLPAGVDSSNFNGGTRTVSPACTRYSGLERPLLTLTSPFRMAL